MHSHFAVAFKISTYAKYTMGSTLCLQREMRRLLGDDGRVDVVLGAH